MFTGTFGDVEYVFLVGVSGSVPHYTDFYKHCRLGDVVMATPNDKGFLYIFCDKIVHDIDRGELHYALKSWSPQSLDIQETSAKIQERNRNDPSYAPWETYIREGQEHLAGQEVHFNRPPPETDRLYMNIGGSDIIEVGHPPIPEEAKASFKLGQPLIKTGSIASGKPIVKDDALRMDFAARHSCVTFDTEFDQVLESIVGNRKDSFAFVRGVCDYLDGTKGVEWQPYSALSAAAYMKTLIENLPPVQ